MTRPKGMDTESRAPVLYWLAAFFFALLIALVGAFKQAEAQARNCAPYPMVLDRITGPKYEEVQVATALSGPNKVVVFVNPTTGTFTFVVRLPGGMGCISGGGTNWKFHSPADTGAKKGSAT